MEVAIDSHTMEVNGQRLHYLVAGDGAPVVLLHGWPQHFHHWRRWSTVRARVKALGMAVSP